jgi:hypothetical protein
MPIFNASRRPFAARFAVRGCVPAGDDADGWEDGVAGALVDCCVGEKTGIDVAAGAGVALGAEGVVAAGTGALAGDGAGTETGAVAGVTGFVLLDFDDFDDFDDVLDFDVDFVCA